MTICTPGEPCHADACMHCDPAGYLDAGQARKAATAEQSVPDEPDILAELRDGTWLDAQEFPPLAYAVPGLIPEGMTILIGPPKCGKSWLVVGALLGVAAGGRVLSHIQIERPRRVLYLALEDGDRRMQTRCRALLGPGEPIPTLFHYMTRVDAAGALRTIDAFLQRFPDTALVVLDTLGKVMPPANPGESAYQRDYRVGGRLKKITDDHPGLALVVVHHDRKATSDDFVDGVSGTHGLAGAADTLVVLCRKRNSVEAVLKVTGRDVPECDYALVMADGPTWMLDGKSLTLAAAKAKLRQDTENLSDTTLKVFQFAQQAGPAGVTPADVDKGLGMENSRQYLKRLADDHGLLIRSGRGLYTYNPPDTPVSQVSQGTVSAGQEP